MLDKFLKKILPAPREKQPHELPFRVIRRSGNDYYAIGVLPQFANLSPDPSKPPPYHVLKCKKISSSEAAIWRVHCEDRSLVSKILSYEKNQVYKSFWASCLYGGRFDSGDSGTHTLEFEYHTRPGCSRALVRWLFDFGISEQHAPSQVALEICDYLVQEAIPTWGETMLTPRKHARCYWHTAIRSKMLHAIGVLDVKS